MKHVALAVIAVALIFAVTTSCGKGPSFEEDGPPAAYLWHPEVPKVKEDQTHCPVCGETPLKKELHTDVGAGFRIYFDKQECLDKFKENPEEGLKKFKQQVQEREEEWQSKEKSMEEIQSGQ